MWAAAITVRSSHADIQDVPRFLALIAAVGLAIGCAGRSVEVVHADGRVGLFRLDVTTERDLRAKLGKPDGLFRDRTPAVTAPHGGRTLVYVCGRDCRTQYSFNADTRTLSDFWTQSRRWSTARGSRPGMAASEAAARERVKIHPGCSGDQIDIRSDRSHAYVLIMWRGKVDSITYLGPHSVYYDGLC
jgi:hypothetical protein